MITIGTKVMCIKSFHDRSYHYIEKNIYTITKIDKMFFQHSKTLNYYEEIKKKQYGDILLKTNKILFAHSHMIFFQNIL